MNDYSILFGQKLRETRQKKGVSQEKLAEMAELHRTYISSVERGERNISIASVKKLADALGVQPAELMPESGETGGIQE